MTKLIKVLALLSILACIAPMAGAQQDFSFTTSGGQTVSVSSMRGKVLVLFFSGVQDPQRREGLKALASLAERYQGKDVTVCWVSVNSQGELTDEQLKSAAGTTPSVMVLRDTNQAAFKRLSGKLAQLPTVVVLDRQGNPVGQPRGGFNPNSDFINDMSSTIDGVLRH